MEQLYTVRMPKYPECWDTCGNCAQGEVFILDVLVKPGDHVYRDDNLISLETGKVALDIPTPKSGTIVEVRVEAGQYMNENDIIVTLNPDPD